MKNVEKFLKRMEETEKAIDEYFNALGVEIEIIKDSEGISVELRAKKQSEDEG